jgi:hypothetical protein
MFTMDRLLQKFVAMVRPSPVSDEPLEVVAVPGLMTLLDVALYQAVEGQLTATVTSSHNLLASWLDLKRQSVKLLNCLQRSESIADMSVPNSRQFAMESFARTCLDVACDAIQRLTTDRFAETANLSSDPAYESNAVGSTAVIESARDTGRRAPIQQRGKDCWESERLFCPDYVHSDDAAQHCQRLLRLLLKNPFVTGSLENSAVEDPNQNRIPNKKAEQEASVLLLVVTADLPARLVQFRASIEADSVVSKRLYLIKSEYRAPFRAFLETHQSLQRAPSLELINEYLQLPKTKVEQRRTACKDRLQKLLATPVLVEALALEQKCEEYEIEMVKALYSFSELARYLDHKRARIGAADVACDLTLLLDTLRRLKGVLCRKAGPESSTGIRPILLDLQGIPRDEEQYDTLHGSYFATERDESKRLGLFVQQLQTLQVLCQRRYSFFRADKRAEVDIPSSIARGCEEFDHELFSCHFQDWYAMVQRQHELTSQNDLDDLVEKIRRAEMQMSLASATNQSLEVVRLRLEVIASDRQKRWQVLQEMIEEVCLREMNLHVKVSAPDKEKTLALQPTSALGIFGLALQMAGEPLPIG